MRAFGDLTAVHLALWEQGDKSSTRLRVPLPNDQWHAAIIDLCWQRFQYCLQVYNSANSIYEDDLERRQSYDGRVINGLPVRLSWGIGQVADLLRTFGSTFEVFSASIDTYREKATFGNETGYEHLSRRWLRHSRDLRGRIEFALQTSMWVQWISESLEQANEIATHLHDDESHYLQQYGLEMFSYIAHPPLLVAVLTSAAMVEEVGAVTVKELDTGINPELDDTRLEEVIGWLRDGHLAPENIDLDLLDDTLRDARNELSHSMTARGTTVTIDSFETYVEAVHMAMGLGLSLAAELATDVLTDLDELPLTPQ
ncbi:hypothetical protein [Halobellus ruber]|uniref:Uncharacterized protein n=1 Tax=Halobellus ruber TaxID=2761102 RepID=A0A7J9SG30_9EURY|nr:hypothetical protein [Halobellus ruber]MBB6645924.1 hypothetical protein [Halobellus ruber]